jgi:hypothetical protein
MSMKQQTAKSVHRPSRKRRNPSKPEDEQRLSVTARSPRKPRTAEDDVYFTWAPDGYALTSRAAPGEAEVTFPEIKPTDYPAEIVLGRLRALRLRVDGYGPWMATCPAHADTRPSLSVRETAEGILLLHCFSGCRAADVLDRLGLGLRVLYPSLYATQHSPRRPNGALPFYSGGGSGSFVEPSDGECERWARLLRGWQAPRPALVSLAARLRLPLRAIRALGTGFDRPQDCWVLPEWDARGRIVGLVRRFRDGSKKACEGSLRGLTLPQYGRRLPGGPLYIAEGASDAAAIFSMNKFAVGRPAAGPSAAVLYWLIGFLRQHPGREVIVVGDRDANGAGHRGACNLARCLSIVANGRVKAALPAGNFKDVRAQIIANKWDKGLSILEYQDQ